MIKLVISDNEGTTTVVPLVRDEISIGRQEGNTIRLTERNVSRRHARLLRQGTNYVVEDLGSYNGVLVNGKRSSGATPVQPGDEIGIADYSLVVQSEAGESASPRTRSSLPPPPTPARLVMLADPTPGAVFSLPTDGLIRMGRSEDLAIPINHRSVSREHAQIELSDGGYLLTDLSSANGVFINGRKMSQHLLMPGDIVELGQVLFRYVGKGEDYEFDPTEAARYSQRSSATINNNVRLAAILLVTAIVVAVVVLVTGEDDKDGGEIANPAVPSDALAATAENGSSATAGPDDKYLRSLSDCERAIAGNRYTEASAHAVLALAARPGDKAALACQAEAQRLFDDEQAFAHGVAALADDDAVTAYDEFSRLSEKSSLRNKPEVQQAKTQYVAYQLLEGRGTLTTNPKQAQQAAETVLAMEPLSDADRSAAETLLADAANAVRRSAAKAATNRPRVAANATAAPAPGGWVAPKATPPTSAPPAGMVAPAAAPAAQDPMDAANDCLARGDNQCVIRALAGKARTEPELALLIETYRAMGNTASAQKYMTVYVSHYPTGRRAQAYRAQLDRAAGN